MQTGPERDFGLRAARLLRAAANDLKRDDAAAESELGLPPGSFARLTAGEDPLSWELVRRICAVWPLNERDLLPVHDDCPDGVRVHSLACSRASSRTLARGGRPYYEYRDTAMSRVASYRPEWIRMLQLVSDNDPENAAVEWNQGHLLYQFTYFVGPVNYYSRWRGTASCTAMNTGDSVWGVPFAPHSFAARSDAEPAYILALTYGGDLMGDAQRELAVLGAPAARQMALPLGSTQHAQAALLRSFTRARMMTPGQLAAESKMPPGRVERLCAGDVLAGADEICALAGALGVSGRDLLPPESRTDQGIHVQRRADAPSWDFPAQPSSAYRVTRLAADPLHPHTTALELTVRTPALSEDSWLTTYQHQYLYVLGDRPLRLEWQHLGTRRSARLEPGDSCYILPLVPVAFRRQDEGPARVLLLRVGGAASTDVRFALSTMAEGGVDRYLEEDRTWYRAGTRDSA